MKSLLIGPNLNKSDEKLNFSQLSQLWDRILGLLEHDICTSAKFQMHDFHLLPSRRENNALSRMSLWKWLEERWRLLTPLGSERNNVNKSGSQSTFFGGYAKYFLIWLEWGALTKKYSFVIPFFQFASTIFVRSFNWWWYFHDPPDCSHLPGDTGFIC